MTASNPEVIERCLFANLLDKLTNLLYQTNTPLIKETLWSFSNITAGPVHHVEKFFESDAFDRILILSESRNLDLKKEALYVLANAITGADIKLRGSMYDRTHGHILKVMTNALLINESRLILQTIDAIDDILALDHWYGTVGTDEAMTLKFEKMGGLELLEECTKNPNMDIYNRALAVMNAYYETYQVLD